MAKVPDIRRYQQRLNEEVRRASIDIARALIRDVTDRIKAGVDLGGAPQFTNQSRTLLDKAKEHGSATPLVAEGILSDPSRYLINGSPADSAQIPDKLELSIELPPERQRAIPHLQRLGYRVPWGVSRATQAQSDRELGQAAKAAGRAL